MKQLKILMIITCLLFIYDSNAQETIEQKDLDEINNQAEINDELNKVIENIKVGDTLILKKTEYGYYNFVIPDQERTKTLKKGAKLLGLASDGLSLFGISAGNFKALQAGIKLGNASTMAEYGLRIDEFFRKSQMKKEVIIDNITTEEVYYGFEEVIADFKIKRKAYKVHLKRGLLLKEVELKSIK